MQESLSSRKPSLVTVPLSVGRRQMYGQIGVYSAAGRVRDYLRNVSHSNATVEAVPGLRSRAMPRPTRTPWTAEELEAQLPRHRLGDLADPARHLSWLEAIARLGVAVVTDIPPTVDGLRSVAGRIGIIESTNYGVEWDIVTTDDPFNQVDSDLPLRVHSDLPYRRQPPGMQILLAAETGAAGGETILVDGHRLAERIRTEDPAAWATLTTVSRAFSYVRPDQRYIGGGPVIGLDDDGEVDVIRHAPDLVLPCRDGDQRLSLIHI